MAESLFTPLSQNKTLVQADVIELGMPLDNLSVDANGDIFAAAFPAVFPLIKSLDEPFTTDVPSTVQRGRRL